MYIKKMHILIEQKLQNIGVFAYSDFQKEEIDLQIDSSVIKLIEDSFGFNGTPQKKFEQNQLNKDKLKELEVRNLNLNFIKEGDEYIADLPDDYVHLISDKSQILYKCLTSNVPLGKIEKDSYYLVEEGSLEYNTKAYTKGEYFKGIDSFTSYSFTSTVPKVIKLESKITSNRLTKGEFYEDIIGNSLTTSSTESLISAISGKKLIIFSPDFFVDKVSITYIKEPKTVKYKFKTYTNTDALINNKEYEVIKGSVSYNGNTYVYGGFDNLLKFKVETSKGLNFTNIVSGSLVRELKDGDSELNNIACYYIIDGTVKSLAIASEQNQQKIVNLEQNGIPN